MPPLSRRRALQLGAAAGPGLVGVAVAGFSVLEVTPQRTQMDWYVLTERMDPRSAAVFSSAWEVPAGSRKVRPAARRLS